MNFLDALHTSSSGLNAQRMRMNVISSNLANAETTRTSEGGCYKRKDIVFCATSVGQSFESILSSRRIGGLSEVKVVGITEDPKPGILEYNPRHPDADENGYLSKPNINLMEEMVNMITATRSYEANVAAIEATKSMALKALEIGR